MEVERGVGAWRLETICSVWVYGGGDRAQRRRHAGLRRASAVSFCSFIQIQYMAYSKTKLYVQPLG